MTKTYCDRCGKQKDEPLKIYHYDGYKSYPYVYDCELCEKCQKEYRAFIDGAMSATSAGTSDPLMRRERAVIE